MSNEPNSPRSEWTRRIRSTKLEIRDKLEEQMIQTNQSAPNEPNFCVFGLEMRITRKGKTNRPFGGGRQSWFAGVWQDWADFDRWREKHPKSAHICAMGLHYRGEYGCSLTGEINRFDA